MRLLLDTHALLWTMTTPERIPASVRIAIASPTNQTFVSVASLWKIAIKVRNGRLEAPDDLPALVRGIPHFRMLAVTEDHAWRVRSLQTWHGDPFDHLLIAQALVEGMTLVTHDRIMSRYDVPVLAI